MPEPLKMPEMTATQFEKHMADEDFLRRFGNPVVIRGRNDYDLVCMAREYYERMNQRLAEYEEDENIRYWIYEFHMPWEKKLEFEHACAECEMTADEFFETLVLDAIRMAETDPEGFRQSCLNAKNSPESDIRLVRCYPVYRGETEAQAYRRAKAEEDAEKRQKDRSVMQESGAGDGGGKQPGLPI